MSKSEDDKSVHIVGLLGGLNEVVHEKPLAYAPHITSTQRNDHPYYELIART